MPKNSTVTVPIVALPPPRTIGNVGVARSKDALIVRLKGLCQNEWRALVAGTSR